jgi:LytS/YehU family sensor histidine kinase
MESNFYRRNGIAAMISAAAVFITIVVAMKSQTTFIAMVSAGTAVFFTWQTVLFVRAAMWAREVNKALNDIGKLAESPAISRQEREQMLASHHAGKRWLNSL